MLGVAFYIILLCVTSPVMLHVAFYAECHHAERRFTDSRGVFYRLLNCQLSRVIVLKAIEDDWVNSSQP